MMTKPIQQGSEVIAQRLAAARQKLFRGRLSHLELESLQAEVNRLGTESQKKIFQTLRDSSFHSTQSQTSHDPSRNRIGKVSTYLQGLMKASLDLDAFLKNLSSLIVQVEKQRPKSEMNSEGPSIDVSRLKRPNGAIGTQGVTTEQVESILKNVLCLDVTPGLNMRALVDLFKSNEQNVQSLLLFTKNNPIQYTELPDGTIHLKDGHHRTFLLDQAGITQIPAVQQ